MLTTKLVATAQCDQENSDGSGCVHTETYSDTAESCSLVAFVGAARKYFEQRGWNFYGTMLCPDCAAAPCPRCGK